MGERQKKIFQKNIKDILNATCKGDDDIYIEFQRISPTTFERRYTSPTLWVCAGCGDVVDKHTQNDHKNCIKSKINEEDVAKFIGSFLVDDELNIVELNNGYDDQCYISLC